MKRQTALGNVEDDVKTTKGRVADLEEELLSLRDRINDLSKESELEKLKVKVTELEAELASMKNQLVDGADLAKLKDEMRAYVETSVLEAEQKSMKNQLVDGSDLAKLKDEMKAYADTLMQNLILRDEPNTSEFMCNDGAMLDSGLTGSVSDISTNGSRSAKSREGQTTSDSNMKHKSKEKALDLESDVQDMQRKLKWLMQDTNNKFSAIQNSLHALETDLRRHVQREGILLQQDALDMVSSSSFFTVSSL